MKYLLPILLFISQQSYSAEDFFNSIWHNETEMKKMDSKYFGKDSDRYVFTIIDQRKYLPENSIYDEYESYIVLYKVTDGKRKLLLKKETQNTQIFRDCGDCGGEYFTKNGYLYINYSGVHHGSWGYQYQFSGKENDVVLIGSMNYRDTALREEVNLENETNTRIYNLEKIYGSSTNYNTNKKQCWIYIGNCLESKNTNYCEIKYQREQKFLQPLKISYEYIKNINSKRHIALANFLDHERDELDCNFSTDLQMKLAREYIKNTPPLNQ